MPAYRYKALDAQGREQTGVTDADTPRQARAALRALGLHPTVVTPQGGRGRRMALRRERLSIAELALLTRQLATLVAADFPLEQAIANLAEEVDRPNARTALTRIKAEIAAGHSFATALAGAGGSFPDYYRALVRSGEDSGSLPEVLLHLADHLDASVALRQKTTLALLYPALVSVVAVMIVLGLLIYVVPQVVQVFQQSRQALPVLTRALIALSDFLLAAWPYLALATAACLVAGNALLRREDVLLRWHRLLLRLPLLGPLVRSANTARFSGTLAILLKGGVPLLSALSSSARVLDNLEMRRAVDAAAEQVREGTTLARALSRSARFPPLLAHLVANGETSGRLDHMLLRAAQIETQALERRLAVLVALIEPLMILLMGGFVLLIVLAILLPIIEINQLVR